jgi:hypothetical protein
VFNLIAKAVGFVRTWGAGSWLKGLIAAMGLGALAGGAMYVYPEIGVEVKKAVEAPAEIPSE